MPTDADPIVGNWYEHPEKGQKFGVVAVDEDSGVVEVQVFDGTLDEIELAAWYELDLEPIETPEDWTGPLDDVEVDDLGYTETEMGKDDWSASLQEVKKGREETETGEEESDEWGEGFPEEEPWEGEQ